MACIFQEHIQGDKRNHRQQELSAHLSPDAVFVRETAVVLGFQAFQYLCFVFRYLFSFAHNALAGHHEFAAVAQLRQAAFQLQCRAFAVKYQTGNQYTVAQQARFQVLLPHKVAHSPLAADVALQHHHSTLAVGIVFALDVTDAVDAVNLLPQAGALGIPDAPLVLFHALDGAGTGVGVGMVVQDGGTPLGSLFLRHLALGFHHRKIIRRIQVGTSPDGAHFVVVALPVVRMRENHHNQRCSQQHREYLVYQA